jgi:putative hemolysin
MDTIHWELLAILAMILANGFFALSEFSIIASRSSRLKQEIEEGHRGARKAARLHEDPDRFLATIQIGITLVGTTAGVFGGATIVKPLTEWLSILPISIIADYAQPLAVVIITIAITFTNVVLGELVPKYLALSNPEKYARLVARPVSVFTRAISFLARGLSALANLIVRMLGVRPDAQRDGIGEDEINMMIFEGRQKGLFDETEVRLVRSVFDFADSTARRAMTPRTDVTGFDIKMPAEQVIAEVTEQGFTRYPVYEESLDHVIGVLYAKDLLMSKRDPESIVIKELLHTPIFIPDSMPLSKVLWDFQRNKTRMAIVLDEFGGTAGIIALHDVLEELVGEIQDEDDTDSPELVKHSENVAYADGSVWPGAINELMDSDLPEDNTETLAGMIFEHLGRLPRRNEIVQIADMKIHVMVKDGHRLVRLKLEKNGKDT